jgi:trigger factor
LKGKSVELQCTLHAKEKLIPAPWDEQLAKRLGYKSVEDAHAGIRATLMKSYEETRALHAFDQVVDHVLAHNQFEIPESLVENAIDRALAEANASAQKKKVKSDDQQLRDQYREIATKQVQGILALGHIARQEKISVTDDEMFHEMAAFAVSQQKDPRQFISKEGAKMYDEFRGQIMIRKAINRLLDMGKIQYISEKSNSA